MSTYIGTSSNNSYHYNVQLQIASGAYGSVYYGLKQSLSSQEAELIAVKVFERGNSFEEISSEAELKALSSIKHENVVEVFDLLKTPSNYGAKKVFLVLELCNRGNIEDFVKNNELSELEIRFLFKEIAKGVHYIHKKSDFVHRDIKANNILLKGSMVKIADFGEAKQLKQEEEANTFKGTPLYMNPQMLNGEKYTNKADVFSLGVLLYFMYYKKTPWFSDCDKERSAARNPPVLLEKYKETVDSKDFEAIFEHIPHVYCSDSAKNLIKNMIQIEEEDRYDIDQVLKHPFLRNFEKNGIFSPKITRNFERCFFMEKTGLLNEEKKLQDLLVKELRKQKVREIMERMYYEKDKVLFIHNCMKNCYKLKKKWEDEENWLGILLVLSRLAALKSQLLYRYLKEERKHLMFREEHWKFFYENKKIYSRTLEIMKESFEITAKNLQNLQNSLGSKHLTQELLEISKEDYKPNLAFFEELQKTILAGFKLMKGCWEKCDKLAIALYDLMIIVTMNGSMTYCPERGIVNYEKYHEDKIHARSVRIMKTRLESFYKLIN